MTVKMWQRLYKQWQPILKKVPTDLCESFPLLHWLMTFVAAAVAHTNEKQKEKHEQELKAKEGGAGGEGGQGLAAETPAAQAAETPAAQATEAPTAQAAEASPTQAQQGPPAETAATSVTPLLAKAAKTEKKEKKVKDKKDKKEKAEETWDPRYLEVGDIVPLQVVKNKETYHRQQARVLTLGKSGFRGEVLTGLAKSTRKQFTVSDAAKVLVRKNKSAEADGSPVSSKAKIPRVEAPSVPLAVDDDDDGGAGPSTSAASTDEKVVTLFGALDGY